MLGAQESIYLTFLAVAMVIRFTHTHRAAREWKMESSVDSLLLFFMGAAMFVLPLAYIFTSQLDFATYSLPPCTACLGAGVFTVALWLFWRSHANLGSNWSPKVTIREKHTLVTTGVYGRIRHPMYAAHLWWGVAQLLLLPNYIAGPAMLVALAFFLPYRIPREEKALLKEFGPEYEDYMKKTGRVFPKV